ncbi:solute carrier family 51 subunit beta isoform X1 [Cyprinodon tularosa]|uniref:solute carrier family 51 subunit beta isoform X1 n=1 Tax=Cyprinodon tularosa TaxID=77115 RepID=UPI0018E1FCBD|nr:solute carrier family 51 subunit beta isoform X1 [Cyprinodon tularosa]
MLESWIFLLLLVPGGQMFMLHNTQFGLCLEDSANTSQVILKKCDLDSLAQQWVWISQGVLMCVESSRCLSAQQDDPVQTQSCPERDVEAPEPMWDCSNNKLISRNTSLPLSTDGQRVLLSKHFPYFEWKSIDERNVCTAKIRFRRANDNQEQLEDSEEPQNQVQGMTEKQKEYLRWFYRTEEPAIWTYVLLGLAFVCLLVGFMLLGMGTVANSFIFNRSRKEIAKYKAAASLLQKNEGEELEIISALRDNGISPLSQGHSSPMSERDTSEIKAGDIVVTWKDGNTSCLYSDHSVEKKLDEEVEKANEEKLEEVWQEREAHDEVGVTE